MQLIEIIPVRLVHGVSPIAAMIEPPHNRAMIDLEKEHEAFNAEFKNIGREYSTNLNSVGFSGTLSANELGWLACAESKQAEIDALKAQLEQLDKVWISVDFMLPNEGEKVLIMIGDEQTVAEKCNVFGFIDVIDREALRTDLITYWMPLPKPPVKEATQENSHE